MEVVEFLVGVQELVLQLRVVVLEQHDELEGGFAGLVEVTGPRLVLQTERGVLSEERGQLGVLLPGRVTEGFYKRQLAGHLALS